MKKRIIALIEPVIISFIDALGWILEMLTRAIDWLSLKLWGRGKQK